MHQQAMQAVHRMVGEAVANGWAPGPNLVGLDVGGQAVNGSAREHVPVASWDTLDLNDETAEIRADARTWQSAGQDHVPYDVVMSTECMEHVRWWPLVVRTCFEACIERGLIIITCAASGRPEHGAQGGDRQPGEWYENVEPSEFHALISEVFKPAQWRMDVRTAPDDIYLWAIK